MREGRTQRPSFCDEQSGVSNVPNSIPGWHLELPNRISDAGLHSLSSAEKDILGVEES
jgi:hypothetical protein